MTAYIRASNMGVEPYRLGSASRVREGVLQKCVMYYRWTNNTVCSGADRA